MNQFIDIRKIRKQEVMPLSDKFRGKDQAGNEIGFNSYYMEKNGTPFFGISGECHYSRVQENQWEDTILKMKMGGINVISTYIFWIHHEEEEGKFRFDGNRNLRKFVQLCEKHQMYVILRIGPFNHGEVRNGGLPDWLYGKAFDVRSTDEGFLHYTRRFYHEISAQVAGLLFKDGGPVIGTQIENEYMHSAAPWESTTGITNEWVTQGNEGDAYMRTLKTLAQEEGIITPFYTCTGWGGAAAPADEMMPLWGGYAFWPWIFYNYRGEHPKTPEYIYRDNHNDHVPSTYNFAPTYLPESLPYACCEMGGGMNCYYHYRFKLPYESVDAMANIKLASGCNFLGYYMYRGGSNPRGEKALYLNECQCPKISYDYQAPIGEYGQLRPSYYRLKALHMFISNFQEELCSMVTMLPENAQTIDPSDVDTLRYAVRCNEKKGFLFLNNYQDHAECRDKTGESVSIELADEKIVMEDLSMKAGEEAILPFNMEVGGYLLKYASVQPLSIVKEKDKTTCFFFMPDGMKPDYVWENKNITDIDGTVYTDKLISIRPDAEKMTNYTIHGCFGSVQIVTLTREQSLCFYEIDVKGKKTVLLSSDNITFDGEEICIENSKRKEGILVCYPQTGLENIRGITGVKGMEYGIFQGITYQWQGMESQELEFWRCGENKYCVEIPSDCDDVKDRLLQISYKGDVGHAFFDGTLISDNFCNDDLWEIGLKEVYQAEAGNKMTIYITPLKKERTVDVSSTMAGRAEQIKNSVAELSKITMVPVREATIKIGI